MLPYADPLFGILIFVAIVASAALLDYARNRYKDKQKDKSIKNLTKSYEFVGLAQGVEEFLALSNNPIPTLQFIANAYTQSGNTQEAIKIYLSILDNLKHSKTEERIEILHNLGMAYYNAGFLQRAKNIFLEILKNYPRNPQVLVYLLRTYENLNEYKNAIDALECIEEIYNTTPFSPSHASDSTQEHFFHTLKLNKAYLCALLLINQHNIPLSDKIQKLDELKAKEPRLEKVILQYFKNVSFSLFWDRVQESRNVAQFIDMLWSFEQKDVPLESLTHKQILDVYRAKGWINDEIACDIFELENMRILRRHSLLKATLSFEYRCHGCKQIFPFENARCSSCGELLSSDVVYKIQKVRDETSYPLL